MSQGVATKPLSLKAVLPWTGLMLLFITLPYVAAWVLTPPGKIFLASLINPDDTSVYLSAMRQGRDGMWFFHYSFSPERLSPSLAYLPYMVAGRLVGLINGSLSAGFHLFRLLASIFTLAAFVFWTRQALLGNGRLQVTAWFLIVFGGGIGWFVAPLFLLDFKQLPDLGVSEWGTLMPMLGTPHFALGLGLEALLFACVLRLRRSSNGRAWAMGGAATALALALIYPFNISIAGLVIGFYMLTIAWQARRIPWREWLNGVIILGPLLPFVYYYGVWARRDPNWELTQFSNNVIAPPSPVSAAIGWGLIGVLALVGLWHWHKSGRDWLVPVWAIVNFLAIYLPVPFAGRFVLGLIVPVATLAAYGLEENVLPWLATTRFYLAFSRLTPTPYDTLRRVFLILTIPSTLMVVLFLVQAPKVRPDFPLYLPRAEVRAAEWLAENGRQDDLILVHYPVGNYLPRVTGSRVFIGQTFLTIQRDEKIALLQKFWHEDTAGQWREEFIRHWGVTKIYQGEYERAIAGGEVTAPGEVIYQAGGVTIYEVVRPDVSEK